MDGVYAQLTCLGLAVAGFLALVLTGISKQGKVLAEQGNAEPEYEPADMRDEVILTLIDEGMDPVIAMQVVEDIQREHPEYGLHEILEEARRC